MRYLHRMRKVKFAVLSLLYGLHTVAFGRGVSPYLPLNLEPEIESQIERVLILADMPALTRPIAASTVLDALPRARKYDPELCEQVDHYLQRFMHAEGIAHASVEGSSSNGTGAT